MTWFPIFVIVCLLVLGTVFVLEDSEGRLFFVLVVGLIGVVNLVAVTTGTWW